MAESSSKPGLTGIFIRVALVVLLCALAASPLAAGTTLCIDTDSDNWQWLHPDTHGQEMRVVRWIPERAEFVAMGDAVVTTTDGDAWTPGHRFAPWMVVDYAWNPTAGEFLAVAENITRFGGAILSSPDLITWTTVQTLNWLPTGIAWNGLRYVVVGDYDGTAPAGNALTSTDGVTWARTDTSSTGFLADVIFAGSRFVAVGEGGTVRTSSDGLAWSTPGTPPPNESLETVQWAGSFYVATGRFADDLFISSDGDVWGSTPLPADSSALAVTGSTVHVIDHRGLSQSWVYSSAASDLVNWSIAPALGRVSGIASNGIDQVAAGFSGTQNQGLNGWNWRFSDDPLSSQEFKHLVALDGVTLASTDSGKILRSSDHGQTWAETNSATGRIDYLVSNDDVLNPLFLTKKVSNTAPLSFAYEISGDGVTWAPVTGLFGSQNLPPGAGGHFFRYSSRDLYSSTDGNTWTLFYDGSPGNDYYYVARHAGLWIVYGDAGRIETSPDAVTWTARTSNASGDFDGPKAVLDGYLYLAAGREIVRSLDGLSWELVQVTEDPIQAMAADGERILIDTFGSDDLQSRDGISWSLATAIPAGGELLTHDGTGWTNAGLFGVAYSAPGLEWTAKFDKAIFNNLRAIAAKGDTVAIVGFDDLLTRVGSGAWQRTNLGDVSGMSSIATDGATFVAAGFRNGPSTTFTPNALFTSADGLEWTERAPRPGYFENVVHGGFGFVTANQRGEIHQSGNGVDWTLRADFPTIYFVTVAWTGQRYVAIGTDGEVVTSLDGVYFQQEPQPIPQFGTPWQGSAIAHRQDGTNALTVLVGDIGRTWVSTDHGRTWAVGRTGSFIDLTGMSSVALIGSEFVATTKGAIATSTNGIDWAEHPTLGSRWVSDLGAVLMPGEDPAVWLVGDDGLVQKAPLNRSCAALEPPPAGPLIFRNGFENGE